MEFYDHCLSEMKEKRNELRDEFESNEHAFPAREKIRIEIRGMDKMISILEKYIKNEK
jgi:predicted RNase H-like nuclease (RuvC/YqgF family)